MRKKILHILNTGSYSGAENVAITTINNMSLDYDFAYASLRGGIEEVLNENNIEYYPLSKMSIKEIKKVIKMYKPDIIHAHDYTSSIYSALSTSNKIIVSHLHNNSPWIKKINLRSIVFLLSSFRYSKVITVSSSITDEYIFSKFIRKKSMVVHNPTNLNLIRKLSTISKDTCETKYDLIFLGRLAKAKDPLRFINIVKKIKEENPKIKAVMVGSGPLDNNCIELINANGLEDTISILGFLKNPYEILNQSKVLILTSKWEGYGLVAIEAMSLGKPVLATPVGGLQEIISEKCGFFCKTDDEFRERVRSILSDIKLYNLLSKASMERAEAFSNIENYINSINKIYKSFD